jgi:putative transcriptional regulator
MNDNRLREQRESAGLTQAQLAHRAGLTVGTISQLERGDNVPLVTTAGAIARVLGVPVEALFLAPATTDGVVGLGDDSDATAAVLGAHAADGTGAPAPAAKLSDSDLAGAR